MNLYWFVSTGTFFNTLSYTAKMYSFIWLFDSTKALWIVWKYTHTIY